MHYSQSLTNKIRKTKLVKVNLSDEPRKKSISQIKIDRLGINYQILDTHSIFIQRHLKVEKESKIFDVFGRGWVFMSVKPSGNQNYFLRPNALKTPLPQGKLLCFIPAFSVIEWVVTQGLLEIEMITSISPNLSPQQNFPIAYSHDSEGTIFDHLQDFLREGPPSSSIDISRPCNKCSLSHRAYALLKQNYNTPIKISELSKRLKTSPSVLSRYFRRCYGALPIAVLNKMRIMNSIGDLLLDDKNILEVSVNSGYSNVRVYNEQFSKIVGNPPSQFLKKVEVEL